MGSILNFKNLEFYLVLISSILNGFVLLGVSYKFFQIVQLYGYKLKGFFKWQKETKFSYFSRLLFLSVLGFGGVLVFNILFSNFKWANYFGYIGLVFYFSLSIIFVKKLLTETQKTPLKETKRMKRLQFLFVLMATLFTFYLILLSCTFSKYLRLSVVAFSPILLYIIFPIVFYISLPLEILIKKSYIQKARKKLAKCEKAKPKIKIGITGSFGKTSTKMILAGILEGKMKVSFSPNSFNTPMGITRFILKDVSASDDVIIAEMGARRLGDIKELCGIIRPDIAIITSIGEQHLETFKNIENVAKAKYEIVEHSSPNAKIFVGDDRQLKKIYLKIKKEKYCTSNNKKSAYYAFASDIKHGEQGCSFTLNIRDQKILCKTKLLGEHNIENITLASAVAFKLGLSVEEISERIANLKPIPHRLELIKNPNGVCVLDDSYNASPQGAKRALDVLGGFSKKEKWVMTPGLVEQGKSQEKANYNLGAQIADVADFVIIVNKINRKAISSGLSSKKFKKENIFYADSLKQGQKIIKEKLSKNSILLIENDLPDNFI